MSIRRVLTLALLPIILLAEPILADRAATEKRAFNASGVFSSDIPDNISHFNGNLSVFIPVGLEYPLSDSLSYQLKLSYNSGGGWKTENQTFCPEGTVLPEHDPENNAGFGWRLSFGHVSNEVTHWTWEDEAGARHGLYDELHPGFPSPPQPGTFFSNDSSTLRLKYSATGSGCQSPAGATNECVLLESPDGVVREFRKIQSGDDIYRATMVRNQYGSSYSIAYGATQWTITDSEQRTHTIHFSDNQYSRVTSIVLAAFGGGTSTYTASYATKTIERRRFDPAACSLDNDIFVDVQVLDRFVQPDDSFWEFGYTSSNASPDFNPGAVNHLRMPSGAEVDYTYELQSYQSQDPGDDRFDRDVTSVFPVTSRTLSIDGQVQGTWTYEYNPGTEFTPGEILPCYRETVVTDPEGNQSVFYFSTTNRGSLLWAYGLPYTYCAPGVGFSETPPFLSSEIYQGSQATGTKLRSTFLEYSSDSNFMGNGKVNQEKNHRIVHQKTVYHDDGDKFSETRFSDFDGLGNFRTVSQSGNFSAQDNRTVTTTYLPAGTLVVDPATGSTTGSDFLMPLATDPWIFGTFSEQSITAANDTSVTEFCFNSLGFRERLRLRSSNAAPANNDFLRVFEPDSAGNVATEKFYGGDNQGAMDNVYNGDLCQMTLPAGDPEYQVEHTYSSGVRATTADVNPCDGTTILTRLDQTIDVSTGLPSAARDSAGVETSFAYDNLGRLTAEMPPSPDAWINFDYQLPTQASPNLQVRITQRTCVNGSTTCSANASLVWKRFEYDGLGRLTDEIIRIPAATGIVENRRITTYNALGWTLTQSVWGSASLVTTFTNYDPFGRAGTITLPGQQAADMTYQGDRVITRRVSVMTSSGTQEDAFTTELYDIHNRLIRVCENEAQTWNGTCSGIETTYLYDVGSRLTRIGQDKNGQVFGQTRRFVYDHRGAMTSERHPEVGITEPAAFQGETFTDPDGFIEVEVSDIGNDLISYTYDARGNVLTKDVQGSTEFDLTYHYDKASRLIRLEETNAGNPRPLKEFFYARSNSGSDMRAGKLVQTKRHNWVDILPPLGVTNTGTLDGTVTESFRYDGPAGRASSKQTRFTFNGTTFAFNLSQTYNALGNVASVTYPGCIHSLGDCAALTPARTVTYNYTKGFLTGIPGFANDIDWQAGGTLHQVRHANGVTYSWELDPATGLPRPYRITTTAGFDTGIYRYDAASNIHQIGSLIFRYDRLSRMVSGQAPGGLTQTATYDNFGNITSLVTNGVTLSTPTDTTSNRLTNLAEYDGAGNISALDFGSERYEYEYDGANMMKHLRSTTDLTRIFIYNADDERIGQFDCAAFVCETQGAVETWTLRGFDNKVLRTYIHPWNEGWQWKEDNVYRDGGQLLAVVNNNGTFHQHPDHLGTPRQVTNSAGVQVARHDYYPFGEEATNPGQDDFALKFTGHERDANTGRGVLDYMHARYCSPTVGRFSSIDPLRSSEPTLDPQLLNRYAYGRNNPVKFVDPDGEVLDTVLDIGFVAYDVFDIARTVVKGENVSRTQLTALGADLLGAAIPFATGGGSIVRVANKADDVVDAVRAVGNTNDARKTLQANKAAGEAFERKTIASRAATDTNVTPQITLKTDSGVRTRVDIISNDPSGAVRCTECKASATAKLTKNQKKAFPEIEKSGATVVGQGKGSFPGGTNIPPTKVEIVRPK